jgi:polysaccharide export outer membrane protein
MRVWHLFTLTLALIAVPGWTAESTDYRFSPGDLIDISVSPQTSFSRSVTVQPDGKISYPVVGQLLAAGLTVAQLTEALRSGLNRQLVDPEVTVLLKEGGKQTAGRVSLLGAVRNPGVLEIRRGTTVAEALASAGGPTSLADLRRVTITRPNQPVVSVDLAQTEKTGRPDQNVVLQPGDLIMVPEGARPTVLLVGEVAKPGSYELQRDARLLDALTLAGGLTPRADLRRVIVVRSGSGGTQTVDLEPLLAGGPAAHLEANVPLQPGDTIILGETDQRIYVLGAIARPDSYSIRPDDRVLDVVVRAGGATSSADLRKAVLVRRNVNGQPVPKTLDLKKIMATGDIAENDLLRPGDVLYVPDKRVKTRGSALDALNLLLPVTGLMRLFGYAR